MSSPRAVKVIGSNGQISLGKQFAGRRELVEEREPRVWLVRTAKVVPDHERWLHQAEVAAVFQEIYWRCPRRIGMRCWRRW